MIWCPEPSSLYTKQKEKKNIIWNSACGEFPFFSHGAGLGFSVWESFQLWVLGRWTLTVPKGTLRAPGAPGAAAGVVHHLQNYSLSVLCPSDPLLITHIIANGSQVLLLLWRMAVISHPPHSPFSSSPHFHNQRAFSLCFKV